MVTTLLVALLAAAASAQQCTYLNEVKPEAWVRAGGDMPGFEYPSDIHRIFPGTLDRDCGPQERDPTFCLAPNPFSDKPEERQKVCNRCPPKLVNYFRLPLWEKYAEFKKEINEGNFYRSNPHLFEQEQGWTPNTARTLKHGFCLTCYALAKAPPPAVLGDGDFKQKPSVTVTTRVACGRQNKGKNGFELPDPTMIDMWNHQINALTNTTDPCTNFPCGDNEETLLQVQQIAATRDEHISAFIKNYTTPTGEVKAVNGHHNEFMEIPFNHAHVLRTEINLNPGLEGYSADIKDGGYSYYDDSGVERYYDGCQALEYGMVALTPGLVETACWMVPMFQEERAKDAKIKAEVVAEAQKMSRQMHQYCVQMRPNFNKDLENGEHERGTRTCEELFCKRPFPPGSVEAAACAEVLQDGQRYRSIAQQRMQQMLAQQQQQQQRQGGQGGQGGQGVPFRGQAPPTSFGQGQASPQIPPGFQG